MEHQPQILLAVDKNIFNVYMRERESERNHKKKKKKSYLLLCKGLDPVGTFRF